MSIAKVTEKRILNELEVNKEVMSYLQNTDYSQLTYLTGIDSSTALIWTFTPDHIYLCSIEGE